jgi:hypothetical protein
MSSATSTRTSSSPLIPPIHLFLAPSGPSSRRCLASFTSPDPAAMEEDDEFGDLYTDILIPTHTPPIHLRAIQPCSSRNPTPPASTP